MVRVAAHPEPVIEAVNYGIAWMQARRPEAASRAFIHEAAVSPGECDIERPARRPRGFVNPDDVLLRTDQIAAKGRVLLLAVSALVLLREREQWQISHVLDGLTPDARLGKFILIEGRRRPDIVKLSAQGIILQPAQCCWLDGFYSFIPVDLLIPSTPSWNTLFSVSHSICPVFCLETDSLLAHKLAQIPTE